ncbi:MAG: CpsB/CapC family capsule biosynthesis tyrosine phosphatase [Solirubrobacteraceae bacterium]
MRTELHFHLLPAVDDGPPDDDAAVALAKAAIQDGTSRVVVTPHVREINLSRLPDHVERLRGLLERRDVPLEVLGGGEVSPDDVAALSDSDLEVIAHGPAGRRWVLLEAPLGPCRPDLEVARVELGQRGFQVLIGHPERSPELRLAQLRDQVGDGAVLQINAPSLLGRHGPRATRSALELVSSGLPFVLASDAHRLSRPPMLSDGALALERAGVDAETIRFAVETGPERLLTEGLSLSEPFKPDGSAVQSTSVAGG